MAKQGLPAEQFSGFLSEFCDKRVAIATHDRADVDGISAAFALSKLFPKSVICSNDELNEGARMLISRLEMDVKELEDLKMDDFSGLIVVDTSAYTLIPAAKGWKILCIIDHHRADGKDMKAGLEILDSSSPSSAEIVANLIEECGREKDISKDVAFALSVGIIADGARFKSARTNTFATLARMMEKAGAKYPELLTIAEPEPDTDAKIAMLKAMQRIEYVYTGGYMVATSEVGSNESDAASLIVEAADVAFVAKWKDKEKATRISARARGAVKIPLNEVMGKVAKEFGGAGGGHAKAAGASLPGVHTDEALKKCVEAFIIFTERESKN